MPTATSQGAANTSRGATATALVTGLNLPTHACMLAPATQASVVEARAIVLDAWSTVDNEENSVSFARFTGALYSIDLLLDCAPDQATPTAGGLICPSNPANISALHLASPALQLAGSDLFLQGKQQAGERLLAIADDLERQADGLDLTCGDATLVASPAASPIASPVS